MSSGGVRCDLCQSSRGIMLPWVVDNRTRLLCMGCRNVYPQGDAAATNAVLTNLARNLRDAAGLCAAFDLGADWQFNLNGPRDALNWRPGCGRPPTREGGE